jgi:glutathione S-transferase
MLLLMTPTSPYARKCRMFAALKRMDLPCQEEPPHAPGSRVPALNPLGKVPTLLRDDGSAVFDSRVIVQLLDFLAPSGPELLPRDPMRRIEVLRWEALFDGVCDAMVLAMMEERRPVEKQDAGWLARQMAKVQAGLEAGEQALLNRSGVVEKTGLSERAWLVGATVTLADLAMVAALGYVRLRAPAVVTGRFVALHAVEARLMALPAVAVTAPPQ